MQRRLGARIDLRAEAKRASRSRKEKNGGRIAAPWEGLLLTFSMWNAHRENGKMRREGSRVGIYFFIRNPSKEHQRNANTLASLRKRRLLSLRLRCFFSLCNTIDARLPYRFPLFRRLCRQSSV